MSSRNGLAIIIGAGPTSGGGIARYLASPDKGNFGVAVLARNAQNLSQLCEDIRSKAPGALIHDFASDTSPRSLTAAFKSIAEHKDFQGLKLKLAIFHVKHSSKEPFLDTTPESFAESLNTFSVGAFTFGQLAARLMFEQNGGQTTLAETQGQKKGTIIFSNTLGALRTNAQFAAYGSTRASARSIAQALAKEHSAHGIHAVNVILNGSIRDEDSAETRAGQKMSAESVAENYLWLANQPATLWTHELDFRPAQEKF